MTVGYSGTPLAQKLGIKAGHQVSLIGAPPGAAEWLEPLPEEVTVGQGANRRAAVTLLFVTWRYELEPVIKDLGRLVFPDRSLWICYPKKAARQAFSIKSDMTDHVVRELALPLGLVDNKVCAVTDIWTGVRVVWRTELRERPTL